CGGACPSSDQYCVPTGTTCSCLYPKDQCQLSGGACVGTCDNGYACVVIGNACQCAHPCQAQVCGGGCQPGEACKQTPNGCACVKQACGNGVVEPPETCAPPGSTLPNGHICRLDCTYCGDGVVQRQDGEECEPPASSPNPYCPNVCTNSCTCLV